MSVPVHRSADWPALIAALQIRLDRQGDVIDALLDVIDHLNARIEKLERGSAPWISPN